MNITFLIGNGFDRNLGLKTTYSDFVRVYKNSNAKNDRLKSFREYISENEELWSSAEVEMGRYTDQFESGDGAAFYECHKDFCEHLAEYLKAEVQKMQYRDMAQDISQAFSNLNKIIEPFPSQEREVIQNYYQSHKSENTFFHFIVFNYTDTLDQCVSIIKKQQGILGSHTYGATTHHHQIGKISHVHGTLDGQMVFGVNDRTQISKPEIFNCEYGDLYEDLLIKRQANQGYQEFTDSKTKTILDNSDIIYIYGMSFGITDTLWWGRICAWLKANPSRHLIVQKHSMPSRGLLAVDYKIEERKTRQLVTSFSKLQDPEKGELEKRIHITGHNIFADIKDIAVKPAMSDDELREFFASADITANSI